MGSWNDTEEWMVPDNFTSSSFLSIIIAARNEAENIEACLKSLSENNFPKSNYEVILIDDHSDDDTYDLAVGLNIPNLKVIKQEEGLSGKKQALKKGISISKGDLILTSDADCTYHTHWLASMISYFENHQAKLITGPIAFTKLDGFLQKFQALDLIGLMAVTASGIKTEKQFMANGSNMIYSREIFDEVDGYRGNEHLASGDDMFLIHKVAEKYPDDIHFVKSKEAIVETNAEPTLSDFLAQRKRWATKTTHYTDRKLVFVLAAVFILSVTILLNIFIFSFFNSLFLFIGLFQLFIKMILDYLFLSNIAKFFDARSLMKLFFPSNIFHLFYITYSGISGLFGGKYTWKGRELT